MRISFLDSLQHLIEMAPTAAALENVEREERWSYILGLLADSQIDRPRRERAAPRVVKVSRSKYRTKKAGDKSQIRHFLQDMTIVFHPNFKLDEPDFTQVPTKQKESVPPLFLRPNSFYQNKIIVY